MMKREVSRRAPIAPEERMASLGEATSNSTTAHRRPSTFERLEKFLRRVDTLRRQAVAA